MGGSKFQPDCTGIETGQFRYESHCGADHGLPPWDLHCGALLSQPKTWCFAAKPPLQTLFAMPMIDFTADRRLPSLKQAFWLYWAVALPLTVAVLVAYASFQIYVEDKHRKEDRPPVRDTAALKVIAIDTPDIQHAHNDIHLPSRQRRTT